MTDVQLTAIKVAAEDILQVSCVVRETLDGRVEIMPQKPKLPPLKRF